MPTLNKASGRNITIAKTAHLGILPGILEGEKSIMIPVSAFVVRLLYRAAAPMSENLILKNIRRENVHCVNHNVSQHMLNMFSFGMVRNHGNTGLWELSPDMIELIQEHNPKAA